MGIDITNPNLVTPPFKTESIILPDGSQEAACTPTCLPDCSWVFDRVTVRHVVTGGTRVEWVMHPMFAESLPHSFQLQMGRTGVGIADDWTAVGDPVEDAFYAIDPDQRLYGQTPWTHYRIELTTSEHVYYSRPEPALGLLTRGDWLKWKSLVRQWDFQFKHGPGGQEGLLLKRKLYGERCSCLDPRTLDVTKPQHTECFGTGFVAGYFDPEPCVFAELGLRLTQEKLDGQRGTTNDLVVQAKMLAFPQLMDKDVWIDKDTDIRYFISGIQNLAEVRGVPVAVGANLKPAPLSHVIYQFPITGING